MKTIDKWEVDFLLDYHCLPDEHRETVVEILKQDDEDQIEEDLNHLDGHCFRMNPTHPRYASNPQKYPPLPAGWEQCDRPCT